MKAESPVINPYSINSVLRYGREQLCEKNFNLAAIEARALLSYCLQKPLFSFSRQDEISNVQRQKFCACVAKRLDGYPIAYITGEKEFYGRPFSITADVLIPRPETEGLVDWVLAQTSVRDHHRIVDLGTGSGVIGISIALHRPHAEVWLTDKNEALLSIAKENAKTLGAKVYYSAGDWLEARLPHTVDIIVSNPPYIVAGDQHLQHRDLRFEPSLALCGGSDGLEALRQIISKGSKRLSSGGRLAVEHGFNQDQAVRQIFIHAGFSNIQTILDGAGHPRITWGTHA